MQRLFKWFLILTKRLYKKASFLVILLLILASVFLFGFVAQKESGFLRIVLVKSEKADEISSQIVQSLTSEKSLIMFTEVSTAAEAVDMVETGRADSAWVFADDIKGKMQCYLENGSSADAAVSVIEREQNVFLRLSREKLAAELYKHSSKLGYIAYTRENLKQLDNLTDAELEVYFDNVKITDELFVFGSPNAVINNDTQKAGSYLTAPLRGLLSVLTVLCGLAAVLYYMQDSANHTFAWVAEKKRVWVAFACVMIAVANVAVMALLALFSAGMAVSFGREVLCVFLFIMACTAFCMVVKQLSASIRLLSSIIPVLIIVMIAVCPVFFTLKTTRMAALLFPPTYYINSIYSDKYLMYSLIYIAACVMICLLCERVKTVTLKTH